MVEPRKKEPIDSQKLESKYLQKVEFLRLKVKDLDLKTSHILEGFAELKRKYDFNDFNEKLLAKNASKLIKFREYLRKAFQAAFVDDDISDIEDYFKN